MPTYEYACKGCGEHLEVVQSFRDDPLTTCPACSGELRKVFGSIGIAFHGPGFYRTDSRDTRHRKDAAKVDASAKSDTGASGDGAKSDGSKGEGAKKSESPAASTSGSSSGSSSGPSPSPKAAAS